MKDTKKHGLNFLEVLSIVFIVLKLLKVINWSWWWVLSPIWVSWGLAIICIIIYFICTMIVDD